MIHDGVELPRLVPIEKAAKVMGVTEAEVRRLLADRELRAVSLNGITHVLAESIADRLGEETLSRHNQDGEWPASSTCGRGLMNLSIRRMERDELERIRDIDRSEAIRIGYRQNGREIAAFDVNWDDGGWVEGNGEHSFARMIRGAQRQLDLGGTAIGAFDTDRLAGIAIYRPRLTPSMGQLALLHVSSGHRRQGVASQLYDEVLRMAHEDGATHLYVSATPTGSAVGFYTSKGFAPTDTPHPDLLAEEPEDIHMILDLRGAGPRRRPRPGCGVRANEASGAGGSGEG